MDWKPLVTLPVAPLWCDLGFVLNSRGNKARTSVLSCHGNGGFVGCDFMRVVAHVIPIAQLFDSDCKIIYSDGTPSNFNFEKRI